MNCPWLMFSSSATFLKDCLHTQRILNKVWFWMKQHIREREGEGETHWEKVSRELWFFLLRRDADHRLRGCCGIKGFVSQSPLTLSPQSRLQVLMEAWTWNNSWPERLTLKCSLCPELDAASGVTGLRAALISPKAWSREQLLGLASVPLLYYLF